MKKIRSDEYNKELRKKEKVKKMPGHELAEINRLAREEGLSYGKYVVKHGL